MEYKEILGLLLTGQIDKSDAKKLLRTGKPIIVFTGDSIPTDTERPIITFGDNTKRENNEANQSN